MKDREARRAAVHEVSKNWTRLTEKHLDNQAAWGVHSVKLLTYAVAVKLMSGGNPEVMLAFSLQRRPLSSWSFALLFWSVPLLRIDW